MRFVVLGAGAVGGVIGGRLFEYGHDVVLIARGEHARAIKANGLTLASAAGVAVLPVPVTDSPDDVAWRNDDVVLLAVKSQDTEVALRQLSFSAPVSVPIACMQNGVANEPAALRRFDRVYGVCVMCPASHLEPGVVVASSSPVTALLDIGRYPAGADDVAEHISAAWSASTIDSLVQPDIMRWKYAKLLRNLGNAVDAVCGPGQRDTRLAQLAFAEGESCLMAANIDFASVEEDRARRDDRLHPGDDVSGYPRGGSSSWQSLARSEGTIEADYLNGEIALLGRQYGVPVPVNEVLQRVANQMARDRIPPGSMSCDDVLRLLPEKTG
jgi:2-dehydropantoate 2-reductase